MTMTPPALPVDGPAHSPALGATLGPARRDVRLVRDSTHRLFAAAAELDDHEAHEQSRLPGWTRGHVLAHLARNSDALINVLAGRPMYGSDEARDGAIERGARRPVAEHLADLRETAARLDGAFAAQRDADWDRTVELRDGAADTVSSLPFRRLVETELHHVDLSVGYGIDDLPGAFVERQLTYVARRFAGHADLSEPIELRTEDGVPHRTGALHDGRDEPVVVTGSAAALVGWLTGRTAGSGLSASASLPVLPPL